MAPFEPVDPKVSFPELERRVLEFWREADIFHRSLEQRAGSPEWVFYEGPPTANGKPGIHHVEPRTFKDIFPRYMTMTGHLVRRKAGWDCHGLPVELEVEKEIGTTGKRDIEAFGIGGFNRLCRESVTRYVDDFERLTERIGFWIDVGDAYWTMNPEYIESVWWSLKRLHERGMLFEADKVTAYCPRCGTALSDHEVALGYETTEDPSVYLRFPIVEASDRTLVGTALMVWTTTPWTLPSNTGAAVDPGADYVEVEADGERLIVGALLREAVFGEAGAVLRTLKGADLVGARYAPPYPNVEGAHRIVAAHFVSMDEGTGVVHLAPAFGADDLEAGLKEGWPVFKPVDDAGRFTEAGPAFIRGLFVKDADPKILDDLRRRGVLMRSETYEHSYPFCWRCGTPLLYYARRSWYVRTTAVKDRLLEVNEDVNWYPDHIKRGRYGDWLENNVDWALSRERYWGTPLPIWRCVKGHQTAVGSLKELGELASRDVTDVDPHRPAIDEVTFACPECGETATRVPEVIDAWYDSGAMPFAQWGYHPDLGRGLDEFATSFPADFISEAIDQTRGWFYTLMAEGVLHFDSTTYRNVVCLGHIVDKDGRKMSKSLGNAIDPFDVLDRHGADALRWFLLTSGSPWASRRVFMEAFDDIVRQFMLTLWNVYSFFVTYANAEGFDPSGDASLPLPLLDRWILSRLASTVRSAREGLDAYDATGAGRAIASFIDDLSNWYVRRSRRRFWNPGGEGGEDSRAAFSTLYECLVTVAKLLAPFVPFITEQLWRNLAAGRAGRPDSVHLADYPRADLAMVDETLDDEMQAARDIVGLGRMIRAQHQVKTRQPLPKAVIHAGHLAGTSEGAGAPERDEIAAVIRGELNVKEIEFAGSAHELATWRAKPDYRALGPRLGGRVKDVAATLEADDGAIAGQLAQGQDVTLELSDGSAVTISTLDVDLSQEVKQGWGVASEGGLTLALDLEITPELRREGIARDIVRLVQEARKAADLQVIDRIVLGVETSGEVAEALREHRDYVAAETLALEIVEVTISANRREGKIDGIPVVVTVRMA